jgi:hypothetical protein
MGGASGGAGTSSRGGMGGTGGSVARGGSGGSTMPGGGASGGLPNVGGLPGIGGLPGLGGTGGASDVPPIPTNGLSLWLRADHGVVQKDGLVQQWLDQSGQHMDAIGSATNVQPKFVANGLNGLPTLDFDGVDDFLTLPDGFADFSQGLAIFIVTKATDGTCASLFETSNGSEIQDVSLGLYQSVWQYEVANEDVAGGVIDPPSARPQVMAAVQRTTGVVDLREEGNLLNQGQFMAPDVALRKANFIAHTLYASCGYFQGQISEVAVYDRAVTDKEVLAIETYLEDHWLLTPAP